MKSQQASKINGWQIIKKDFTIISFIFKLVFRVRKSYIPIALLSAIFTAVAPFINIIMPKLVIDELMGAQRIDFLILYVLLTIVGNFLIRGTNHAFVQIMALQNTLLMNAIELDMGKKIMGMDFEKIEDAEILDLKEKAMFPITNQGAIWNLIHGSTSIVSRLITLIGLVALIATLDIIIILIIVVVVLFNGFLFQWMQKHRIKFDQNLIVLNRSLIYFANLCTNFESGKDVRLYGMQPLIMKKITSYNKEAFGGFKKMFMVAGKGLGYADINIQLQMALAYGIIAFRVLSGEIGIGSLTMYINAANNFSTALFDFVSMIIDLRSQCRYLEAYLEFDKETVPRHKGGIKPPRDIQSITFENVSFRYPKAPDFTLKNISITINKGEKLSVVGMNGAGKTTFIKLLTRLYDPTEGRILLNGVDIREYDYDEYMKLLAVVFQDFKLFAFTLRENIAMDRAKRTSDAKIEDALIKAGFGTKLSTLSKGIDTHMYKIFEPDGTEFSGGETQKVAMARAIFKDAPLIVLDEPTSALDPIAEYEVYKHFDENVAREKDGIQKTTVYISHRLSSCRFCDRIAVFHQGELIQLGTHNELVAEKGSKYFEMWNAQAQYYQ